MVYPNKYKEYIFDRYKSVFLIDAQVYLDRYKERILIDAQNLSMKKIILNCILQLINVTFGFGDPHNTQTKLVPAQPFYRASNGIRIAYSLQKTLKFLLFCYNNCEDGLLDISFLHFFISKLEVYFCSLFCSQLLDIIPGKQCSIAV